MKTSSQQYKTTAIIAVVLFIISIICCVWLTSSFLGLTGCSIGMFIGNYRKYRKQYCISRKILYVILIVMIVTLILSFLLFLYFKDQSIYYVLPLNLISMAYSIYYMMKNETKG